MKRTTDGGRGMTVGNSIFSGRDGRSSRKTLADFERRVTFFRRRGNKARFLGANELLTDEDIDSRRKSRGVACLLYAHLGNPSSRDGWSKMKLRSGFCFEGELWFDSTQVDERVRDN